jgi:hypothetical protein
MEITISASFDGDIETSDLGGLVVQSRDSMSNLETRPWTERIHPNVFDVCGSFEGRVCTLAVRPSSALQIWSDTGQSIYTFWL